MDHWLLSTRSAFTTFLQPSVKEDEEDMEEQLIDCQVRTERPLLAVTHAHAHTYAQTSICTNADRDPLFKSSSVSHMRFPLLHNCSFNIQLLNTTITPLFDSACHIWIQPGGVGTWQQ